jgi:hypothetical protein
MNWFDSWFGGDDGEEETEDGTADGEPSSGTSMEASRSAGEADIEAPESAWATVLYPFPLDLKAGEIRELLEGRGLEWEAVESGGGEVSRIVLAERNIRVLHRDEPYPDGNMHDRLLPGTFPEDRAHVSLEPDVSDPLEKRDMLRDADAYPDPWGERGVMRALTELVRGFLSLDGIAVVLERSGRLAVPSQQFLEFTDDADEGDWHAVKGWLDIDVGGEEDELLRTVGLEVFGLPDVAVRVDHADGWWRRQLQAEALDAAVGTMILENRPLGASAEGDGFFGFEPVDDFRVPLGRTFDEEALESGGEGDFVSYSVELDDRRLLLESTGPATVWETWASADEEGTGIELPSYQALFRYECHELLGTPLGSVGIGDIEGMEEIDCDLYQQEEVGPAHLISNGLGRRARPTGSSGGERTHVELAIRAETPAEPLIDVVANCAAGFELSDEQWGPADILEFEEPLHGFQVFLLAPLFDAAPDRGPAIEVWQLVPLTEDEYDELSEGVDAEAWLEERDGATGMQFAERWTRAT